jgi:hypothetical protein
MFVKVNDIIWLNFTKFSLSSKTKAKLRGENDQDSELTIRRRSHTVNMILSKCGWEISISRVEWAGNSNTG